MKDLKVTWKKALRLIEKRVSGPSFETWLKETQALSLAGNTLIIGVPNDFVKEWLENRYTQLICDVLEEVTERKVQISFVVGSADGTDETSSAQLNPKYTFESFVIGNSNRFAHAAALAVAEAPAKAYNPLL